ncbi:MAG: site-2 protease family protein [Clostridia bacterium]|nr:site-2 protease family protein [Clostridia bacterium]
MIHRKGENTINFLTILLALLVFGVLIFVHELGHFLVARACGVTIREFAVGMGPKLFSVRSKKYETQYSLRLFPIGGFVSMEGEDEDSEDENAFNHKNVWQKIAIIVAGPLMNILLAILVMFVLVAGFGTPISTTVGAFVEGATSDDCGLALDDTVVKVNKIPVFTGNELVYEIMHQGDRPIDLTVIRNGEKTVIRDVVFPGFSESGVTFGEADFKLYAAPKTFGNIVKHGFFRSLSTVKMIWDSLIDMLTGRYGMESVSGPVGITQEIGKAAQAGFSTLLYMCVVISMNLGIFNLLPIPALDGGRLLFRLIEALRGGRPLKPEWENYIHMVGILLLLALMLFISFKDVLKIILK